MSIGNEQIYLPPTESFGGLDGKYRDTIKVLGDKDSTVCIVGNGPSIMKTKKGALINEHDIVIRFNDFKIKGYEKHVGNKTTHWFTGLGGQQTPRRASDIKQIQTVIYSHMTDRINSRVNMKILGRPSKPVLYVNRKMRTYIINKYFSPTMCPTTGIFTICLLLEYYNKPISIIGFDFKRSNETMLHYFGKATKYIKEHNFEKEKDIIRKLVLLGMVNQL